MKKQDISPKPDQVVCDWCGQVTRLIFVHGHYQCGSCRRVLIECCNGETSKMSDEFKDVSFVITIKNMTKEKAMEFPEKIMKIIPNEFPGLMIDITFQDDWFNDDLK